MAPARGHVLFQRAELHPTTLLVGWLAAIVAIQFYGYPLIACGALLIILFEHRAVPAWWNYIRRARWLLLGLWLILAYGAPGDALFDLDWAPTWEGVAAANLQALRLVLILGCLAWLFNRLGHAGLVAALWGLLRPLRHWRVDADRLVIRLSLVLENLKFPLEKGAWRQMMNHHPLAVGPEILQLKLPDWHLVDTLAMVVLVICLLGSVLL